MLFPPDRHLFPEVSLNLLGHLLEERAGGAPAAWARRNLRGKRAQFERLENLLANNDFFGTVPVGSGSQRDANRVANAFLKENCQSRRRSDNALGPHAGLGQPEMERIVALGSKIAI